MENLSKLINERLKVMGKDQKWLADTVGTSQPTISMWISGTTLPRADKLKSISEALGVSHDIVVSARNVSAHNSKEKITITEIIEGISYLCKEIEYKKDKMHSEIQREIFTEYIEAYAFLRSILSNELNLSDELDDLFDNNDLDSGLIMHDYKIGELLERLEKGEIFDLNKKEIKNLTLGEVLQIANDYILLMNECMDIILSDSFSYLYSGISDKLEEELSIFDKKNSRETKRVAEKTRAMLERYESF